MTTGDVLLATCSCGAPLVVTSDQFAVCPRCVQSRLIPLPQALEANREAEQQLREQKRQVKLAALPLAIPIGRRRWTIEGQDGYWWRWGRAALRDRGKQTEIKIMARVRWVAWWFAR